MGLFLRRNPDLSLHTGLTKKMSISTISFVEFISKGAQGRVYRDLRTGNVIKYAIKVDEVEDQSIEDEATFQTVAAMYGLAPEVYKWDDELLLIEMEYIHGSLIEEIEAGVYWYNQYGDMQPLGELFYGCGHTLGKLHSLGILHWDTHPGNWRMKVDPVLIDFGMAVECSDEIYFSQEFKDCLYGREGRNKPYIGLLGILNKDKDPFLESCFTEGYCKGRGFQ